VIVCDWQAGHTVGGVMVGVPAVRAPPALDEFMRPSQKSFGEGWAGMAEGSEKQKL
jgi:hypothetical protein